MYHRIQSIHHAVHQKNQYHITILYIKNHVIEEKEKVFKLFIIYIYNNKFKKYI